MSETKTSLELPVFDISQPVEESSLSSVSLACKEWGFFHIINQGIPKDLYRKLHSVSNHLFSLPSDLKLELGPSSTLKSYTPHFIASPFFESLQVSGPDFFASAQSSAEVLNQHRSEFSEILREYGNQMTKLSERIIQIVLMCLGENFERKFGSQFSNCHGYLRIINYSPFESMKQKEVEGLGMHTDMRVSIKWGQRKGLGWILIHVMILVVNIGDHRSTG